MLDITRDKPINVSVKVAVPVHDHPKFNFVGKLLGPKGNSMKRLQEDTFCKMTILGRGSMRNKEREEELRSSGDIKYAHLKEDLHVEICTFAAPAEAYARIAYALAEVRRFLVPDYHDDIRREQMWEMQALTTAASQSVDSTCFIDLNNDAANTDKDTNATAAEKLTQKMILGELDDAEKEALNVSFSPAKIGNEVKSNINSNTISMNFNKKLKNLNNLTNLNSYITNSEWDTAGKTVIGGVIIASSSSSSSLHGAHPGSAVLIPKKASMEIIKPAKPLDLLDLRAVTQPTTIEGVKTYNIAPNNGRKRSLLGTPHFSVSPTKRTVMALLSCAKNSQTLPFNHSLPAKVVTKYHESLMSVPALAMRSHMPMEQAVPIALSKEQTQSN